MDDGVSIGIPSTTILLWIAGVIALAFFLVIAYDSIHRYRQDHRKGTRRHTAQPHEGNSFRRWYRRLRYAIKTARAAAQQRQKYKSRLHGKK